MNRIIEVKLVLDEDNKITVAVKKEFAPEHGGGIETFMERTGGPSWHHALDVARGMVTLSPAHAKETV